MSPRDGRPATLGGGSAMSEHGSTAISADWARGRACSWRKRHGEWRAATPECRPGPGHNEAPEGTGGRTGQSVRSGSEQVRSHCAPPRDPHPMALRPSNPVPGTVSEIAPRYGLAVRTCPFGQDEMYWPRPGPHNRLIHELRRKCPRLIPEFPSDVDGMWMTPIATSAQCERGVDSDDGGGRWHTRWPGCGPNSWP
jgi:hypothetical protein